MLQLRRNFCTSSTPLVSAVNHMAARTCREKKNKSFFPPVYINLDNRERARARNKQQRRPISLEEKHENYIAAVRVCCTCKVVFSANQKKSVLHVQSFFANQKKSVLHVQSLFFANQICCCCFFYRSRCFHLVSSITRFYIFFEETININSSIAGAGSFQGEGRNRGCALETLRPDNGDVHENVAEKLTSHPFTLFRDYSKGLSYLKEGNSGSS